VRRGFTLIELMTAVALSGIITIALSLAFSVATRAYRDTPLPRQAFEAERGPEAQIRKLLETAFVSTDAADQNTYFIGQTADSGSNVGDSQGADQLTFTRLGGRVAGNAFNSAEESFEERNRALGPVGGVTEVRISLTPFGEAGDRTGLFLRTQTPSDSDPEQGGFEELLSPEIAGVSFEFFDGTDWQTSWDTRAGQRTLPTAVRVTYTLRDQEEENATKSFIVRLKNAVLTGGTT
jgi:prepilin-type N-terminal cleavage/methylation domain-containing protein